jgi:hypothetical protein
LLVKSDAFADAFDAVSLAASLALLAVDSNRAGVRPKGSFADRLKTARDTFIDIMRGEYVRDKVEEAILEVREQVVGLQWVMKEIARGSSTFSVALGKSWRLDAWDLRQHFFKDLCLESFEILPHSKQKFRKIAHALKVF